MPKRPENIMTKAFMDQISKTATPAELWRVAAHSFKLEGFTGGSYDLVKGTNFAPLMRSLSFGYRLELVNAYHSVDYAKLDAVARLCIATGEVLTWDEAWARGPITKEEQSFREMMQTPAMHTTIGIPLFGPMQRIGYATLQPADINQMFDPGRRRWLQSMAQACHLRLCELLFAQTAEISLSPREREILYWVAQGKSNSVIAQLVDCSSNTVDTHLRRIYGKMDVSDRTTAAIKAIGLGLIT